MDIKKQFERMEKLYHFTTFDTALKIIESNCLRFGRLSNMNDIHESDKLMFVDADTEQSIDEFPSDLLDTLYDEIYKYRQISFTSDGKKKDKNGFDLHQMWGLYADKGEGVCLVFDKEELNRELSNLDVIHDKVLYAKAVKSHFISVSHKPENVPAEVKKNIRYIFFHKRKEWEHEQEYRLIKKCQNTTKEEYLPLYHALKYVILSSKLQDTDEVRHRQKIKDIKEKLKKIENNGDTGKARRIPILIYGNGFFNYSLIGEKGEGTLWNSEEGYNVLIPGKNCEINA